MRQYKSALGPILGRLARSSASIQHREGTGRPWKAFSKNMERLPILEIGIRNIVGAMAEHPGHRDLFAGMVAGVTSVLAAAKA
jgi:hypothetical protein